MVILTNLPLHHKIALELIRIVITARLHYLQLFFFRISDTLSVTVTDKGRWVSSLEVSVFIAVEGEGERTPLKRVARV